MVGPRCHHRHSAIILPFNIMGDDDESSSNSSKSTSDTPSVVEVPNPDLEENEGSTTPSGNARSASTKSKGAKSSDVWTYIEECEFSGSFICTVCRDVNNKAMSWGTKNTSNFRKHLIKFHSDRYAPDVGQAKLRRFGFKANGNKKKRRKLANETFSQSDKILADKCLVDFIVSGSQPFAVVENEDFREYSATLEPDYPVPSRNTMKNRVLKRRLAQRAKVRTYLKKSLYSRRVGITTDMWTSSAKRGYMVVTLHYMDDNWKMHHLIIGFVRVLYPHTAARLAQALVDAVVDFEPDLLCKLWSITADNASTNPAMVEELKLIIPDAIKKINAQACPGEAGDDIEVESADLVDDDCEILLLRCFAHSIQLAVKHGLANAPAIDAAIGLFRDIIKKILDSPKLIETVQALCKELKVKCNLPELDCETRWNSTWMMMKSAIALRPVIDLLQRRIRQRHQGYTDFSIDPTSHLAKKISDITWTCIKDFCQFLNVFAQATVMMSGSTYPTLGMVIPVFEIIKKHVDDAIGSRGGFRSTHTSRFAKSVQEKLNEYQNLLRFVLEIVNSIPCRRLYFLIVCAILGLPT